MKKQKLYSLLALSSLVLSNGAVTFAEDVVVGESSATATIAETPLDNTTGVVIGNEITVPSETLPSVEETNKGVTIGTVEETVISESSSTEGVVEKPKPSEEVPVTTIVESSLSSSEASSEPMKESENTGVSEMPTISEIAAEVPLEVNTNLVEVPVVTQSGEVIVATQDSQVVVQKEDGTTEVKAPEAVGAKKQSDGTVVVKSNEGKLQVLPSTGEKTGYKLVVAGILLLVVGVLTALRFKKKEAFYAVKKQED